MVPCINTSIWEKRTGSCAGQKNTNEVARFKEASAVAVEWTVDFFKPEDANGVVELFRSVYGNDYHVKSIYDPDQLIAEQLSGKTYRAVVRTTAGEIIGHTAFCATSSLNPPLYEAVQLLVRHEWRGTNVATELNRFAIPQIPVKYGLKQVWGEAVCNHASSQRAYTENQYAETGCEIDLLPGTGMARSMKAADTGRVAVIVVFRPYEDRPQKIYLPPVYWKQLEYLYADFDHGHHFLPGDGPLSAEQPTQGKLELYSQVAVARMNFTVIGSDFADLLTKFDHQASEHGILVSQVFLPLTVAATGEAVDILRRCGYFLGGVMPRWFGDDGLLMQKVLGSPNFEGIRLYTDRAKNILELVTADWRRAVGHN